MNHQSKITGQVVNGGGATVISNNTNNQSTTITETTSPLKIKSDDQNCLKTDLNGKCTQCSNRFYVGPVDGKCIPVNPLC